MRTTLPLERRSESINGDVVYPGHVELPEIPRGSLDDDGLPIVAAQHLAVITGDKKIRYRTVDPLEVERILLEFGHVNHMIGGCDARIVGYGDPQR